MLLQIVDLQTGDFSQNDAFFTTKRCLLYGLKMPSIMGKEATFQGKNSSVCLVYVSVCNIH